ncbi:MAG: hypothetical protein HW402_971, partial [Dehalococcoidales bacterium]|nr:hypothetical protein [Dehalococcoidales bacterium]
MSSMPCVLSSVYYEDVQIPISEQLGYSIVMSDKKQSSFYIL